MNRHFSLVLPYDEERTNSLPYISILYNDFDSSMPIRESCSFENLPPNKKTYFSLYEDIDNRLDEWPVSNEFKDFVSEACLEFCNTRGLIPAIRLCVEKIKELFSNLVECRVELDRFEDDETQDEGHIVFRISTKSDQQTLMTEYNRWIDWIVDTIDVDKQPIITLTID